MGSGDDYKFLPVNDAIASIGQKVNLIGVVLDTGIPKRSKGTDFCVNIRIFDQSKPSPGISVNFFAETMDKLPQVGCFGDIIQLSHVVMRTYQTEIYALFNKKWSSFALFEGKHGTDYVPYQCSLNYRSRQQDRAFIDGLRKWAVDHPEEMGSGDLLQMKDIKIGDQFNLVCKIVHISEVQKDEWILYVWDGTDTPALPIETRLEDEMENPLPLSLEPSPLPRDTFCTFPSVGTVLRMRIDTGNEKLGIINILKAGKWIKFRNLLCEVRAGMWVATVMHFTRVCHLPDDDDRALLKQRTYDERYSSKLGRMPMQCFPTPSNRTETDYPRVPFVSLMDFLSHSEAVCKCMCVVRVVAILPWRAEDFRSPKGVYRIRLTLEDPTARLHAYLYDEDAVYFFNGYHSADVMTKKRNKLLGIAESEEENGGIDSRVVRRDPPWVQVGLKSYSIDANDVWGSRNYRIFATRFKDE